MAGEMLARLSLLQRFWAMRILLISMICAARIFRRIEIICVRT
jgi:hypothetical protein